MLKVDLDKLQGKEWPGGVAQIWVTGGSIYPRPFVMLFYVPGEYLAWLEPGYDDILLAQPSFRYFKAPVRTSGDERLMTGMFDDDGRELAIVVYKGQEAEQDGPFYDDWLKRLEERGTTPEAEWELMKREINR